VTLHDFPARPQAAPPRPANDIPAFSNANQTKDQAIPKKDKKKTPKAVP
jgi:hypothetical protein